MVVFQQFATVLGVVLAGVGVLGGLLSLVQSFQHWRQSKHPHGDKGTTHYVLDLQETPQAKTVRFMVAGDLLHFLSANASKETGASVGHVKEIGSYYEVKLVFPPESTLRFAVTRK